MPFSRPRCLFNTLAQIRTSISLSSQILFPLCRLHQTPAALISLNISPWNVNSASFYLAYDSKCPCVHSLNVGCSGSSWSQSAIWTCWGPSSQFRLLCPTPVGHLHQTTPVISRQPRASEQVFSDWLLGLGELEHQKKNTTAAIVQTQNTTVKC